MPKSASVDGIQCACSPLQIQGENKRRGTISRLGRVCGAMGEELQFAELRVSFATGFVRARAIPQQLRACLAKAEPAAELVHRLWEHARAIFG